MTPFTVHDNAGRILRSGLCQEECFDMQAQEGEFVIASQSSDETEWVSGGKVIPRPVNPATLSGAHLSSLPAPCVIAINGARYDCDDTTAALDFTYPSTYKIIVEAFPYLDAEFTLLVP